MQGVVSLLGSGFFLIGTFLFTRGLAGHPTSLSVGATLGVLGLFVLGALASDLGSAEAGDSKMARSKRHVRRRSTTGIRSLRMRRSTLDAVGGGR